MRYVALAIDFDGTLAHDGRVLPEAVEALKVLRKSGRRPILVTGRLLPSLISEFPDLELFDLIVAENGALLYEPESQRSTPLAPAPPQEFARRLADRGVSPLEVGDVIVSTWEPHEHTVIETIRDLGLELEVIFNKGAVMTLPSGVNKASGLRAALEKLQLSAHNTVAVGDAENDHAMFRLCELSAAVANALPAVKETADVVLSGDHGTGVAQLIHAIVDDDWKQWHIEERRILLGHAGERDVTIDAYFRGTLLIAGPSGAGKSTVAAGLLERIIAEGYQVCIVDPEGDYEGAMDAVRLGDPDRVPAYDEVDSVLCAPERSVIISLTGVPVDSRAEFFAGLLPRLLALRNSTGRPHWIALDEAHHLLRSERDAGETLSAQVFGILAMTMQPRLLAAQLLRTVTGAIVVGSAAEETLREAVPEVSAAVKPLDRGQAALWLRDRPNALDVFSAEPAAANTQRHRRKYAEGDLAPEISFYFRGAEGKLNLRARNLNAFVQLAEGVDDETWTHHLRAGDIARWFEEIIGDKDLAGIARGAEGDASASREEVIKAIRQRYVV